jgi:outer membrane receptor protein involved in Fe transport
MKRSHIGAYAVLGLLHASCAGVVVATPIRGGETEPAAASDKSAPEASKTIPVVEVKESYDPRRDDTATKYVVRTEELSKYGDTNILDALRRVPGVTVSGSNVSMRGLGSRYTQILINGDKPPPGFVLAELSPDQVERIEIMRSATAEHSMQAIAGTINIVLKRKVIKRSTSAKLSTSRSPDSTGYTVTGSTAGRTDDISYLFDARYSLNRYDSRDYNMEQLLSPAAEIDAERDLTSLSNGRAHAITLMPRITWSPDSTKELVVTAVLQTETGSSSTTASRTNEVGSFPEPDWLRSYGKGTNEKTAKAIRVEWNQDFWGGKLKTKMGSDRYKESGESDMTIVFDPHTAADSRRVYDSRSDGTRTNVSGKYEKSLSPDHLLTTGMEYITQDSRENRHRIDVNDGNIKVDTVEYFDDRVETSSAFVQDEWKVFNRLSLYGGVRWEKIATTSLGQHHVFAQNAIVTPVAQGLYRFADRKGEQIRAALTRTFRAPTLDELTEERRESIINTRFNPDHGGNPDLVPEIANGLDLTFEKYGADGAFFTLAAGFRRIRNHIRNRLYLGPDGRWIYAPMNSGSVDLRNIDVDWRLPGNALDKRLKPFSFRISVNRNWSRLLGLQGPDNQLASAPLTTNLAIDYKTGRFSLAGGAIYRRGYRSRVSETEVWEGRSRTVANVSALWKQTDDVYWRLSADEIRSNDAPTVKYIDDKSGTSRASTQRSTGVRFGLNLELKF